MGNRFLRTLLLISGFFILAIQTEIVKAEPDSPQAAKYYVSESMGDDENDGLSEASPFKTVSRVNALELNPGDRVRFKCGDIWRADPLVIIKSGAVGEPISFGSYPEGCGDQPILSGAMPISGWMHETGNIYYAALESGGNSGKFAYGINQLFRGNDRLTMGRWPNLDTADGGYTTVDGQPSDTELIDHQLPTKDWAGAVIHIKSIRWAMLNRKVISSSGGSLTLGYKADCWGGCAGWGYFLNNHKDTLDQDGEWFYDANTKRIYIYAEDGTPADIEGSVVLTDDDRSWGGITLGKDLYDPIAFVDIENLIVERWFRHGIATPTNLHPTENHHLTIRENTIRDVDGVGVNLAAWVWGAEDGHPDGWRGGYNLLVDGNQIRRANQMGINTYARDSNFSGNTIIDIARIENLGAAGMGCGFESGGAAGGICTEDGDGIRVKIGGADDTGKGNTFYGNRLERIGYNGIDVFGNHNTFEHNLIIEACISKGDCGAVRTFGRDSLGNTPVYNLTFNENMIVDTIGNTDGCHTDFDILFGFGFYFDHYSRDITLSGNTVISSTVHGALFQNSTGTVVDNIFYNNGRTYPYAAAQVFIGNAPAFVDTHSGNILYSLNVDARTLSVSDLPGLGASNQNSYFSPYRAEHIRVNGDKTLNTWQAYSGKDDGSVEHWFNLAPNEPPKSRIFYNDSGLSKTFSLGNIFYVDLDQNPVSGELMLGPYQAQILIQSDLGANLALSMDLLSSTDTAPNEPLTYTISIRNRGLITASQVRIENLLPSEIVDIAWQATPDDVNLEVGSGYIWTIEGLEVSVLYTFIVTGKYSPTLVPGTPLLITATASTPSPEVNQGNNRATIQLGEWQVVYLPIQKR